MKKTTKFLLVLAAVVAMTIGAVSTVMAADDVVIAKWAGDEKNGFTATDADGNTIRRGWAVDKESGIWYYFVNSKMATNRFVTTGGKTYYVNADGAMHTGWFKFTSKIKINFNGAAYDNVAEYFGSNVGSGTVFAEKTPYSEVWFYFDENGVMATNKWVQVDDIWYFMDGPYCLIDERAFEVKFDENGKGLKAKDYKYYGFDQSGAMLAGWIAYVDTQVEEQEATNAGKPYEKPGSTTTKSYVEWAYYGTSKATNGELDMDNGWLKDVNGNWFFMEMSDKWGIPTAITSTYLNEGGYSFYFDESGYMYVDDTLVVSGGKKGTEVTVVDAVQSGNTYTIATAPAIKVDKNTTMVLTFNANGQLITGQQGLSYYENLEGVKYAVTAVKGTNGDIVVSADKLDPKYKGAQWTESFLYVQTKDGKVSKVNYYVDGEMVKLAVLPFGNMNLAFDKDGNIISKETEIDGVKWLPSTETLITGVPFAVIK